MTRQPVPPTGGSAVEPPVPQNAAAVAAIADLAREAAGKLRILEVPAPEGVVGLPSHVPILIEEGNEPRIHSVRSELEAYRTAPERIEGTAQVTTLQSLVDLANRHKLEHSALFARTLWPSPKLVAVIDYHTTDHQARFARHKIEYAFPLTDEFKAWIENNGVKMSQGDFAAFIEDRIADLAAPEGFEQTENEKLFKTKFALPTEMIDLSRGLQIKVAAVVKNATLLQSGEVDIVFQEEHQNDRGEKITVPGLFMVSVPAFVDGTPVRIPARLRYRVVQGKITWSYHLYKWDAWVRERVVDDFARAVKETSLPGYEGTPESARG